MGTPPFNGAPTTGLFLFLRHDLSGSRGLGAVKLRLASNGKADSGPCSRPQRVLLAGRRIGVHSGASSYLDAYIDDRKGFGGEDKVEQNFFVRSEQENYC
jgi:hypothetical protein